MKKHLLALLSATYLLVGCNAEPQLDQGLDQRQQNGIGWNGIGWNGIGWNGIGWNGIGWNGIGWNGIGWNGIGWNGIGWNGIGFSNTSMLPDWGVDAWVNEPGISAAERDARLHGLEYWTGCACGSGDLLKWKGNNPATPGIPETRYFRGNFDLAPTWCRGTGVVPLTERQAVSACLISRINTQGIHNPLSMRGTEASLKLADNEKLFMAYPEGQFWGNLWDEKPSIQDPTTGFYYENTRAFSCYFPDGGSSASLNEDLQIIIGRSCEWGGCGPRMKSALLCSADGGTDGSLSQAYADPLLTAPITMDSDPAMTYSGLNRSSLNNYQDTVTGTENTQLYGKRFRQMSIFLGAWADLETDNWKDGLYRCDDTCAPMEGCKCYDSYCAGGENTQGGQPVRCESPSACNNCQTIVRAVDKKCGLSAACTGPDDCVRDRKLIDLGPECWLNVQFTRPWDIVTGSWVIGSANPHKAGTLLFRYSNDSGAPASIQIRDQIRNLPIPGGGFAPTGSWDKYDNKYIYPIYPGRSAFGGMTPAIEIAIAGDPASVFPHLDYAQLFVGPPMDVKPRELYWSTAAVALDPNATVCTKVVVEADSDFSKTGFVRILPQVSGAALSELSVTIRHNGVSAEYQAEENDANWSKWNDTFSGQDPKRLPWEICVDSNGASGTLESVMLELMAR